MLRAAAIMFATALLTTPALGAYAIAFDTSTGKAAAYNGSFSLKKVKKVALDECGSDCRIVASGKGECAAVVEAVSTGIDAWAVAKGTTMDTAANYAWHECRRKGGVTCRTAAAICD
jgi:Domain of unknown function (DUF4189)